MPLPTRLLTAGLALLPLLAGAAPFQTPGDRDLIRDRQENLLQEQRKRLEELQQLPGRQAPQAPAQPTEQGRCFQIQRIDLQGASLLDEPQRKALLEGYEGKCLQVGQLNDLLKRITDHYLICCSRWQMERVKGRRLGWSRRGCTSRLGRRLT